MKTLQTSVDVPSSDERSLPVLWIGLVLMLAPILTRAMSPLTVLPEWDLSPLMYSVSTPSMTPWMSMFGDGLTMFGSALVVLWSVRRGYAIHPLIWCLLGIGTAGIFLHGWVLGPYSGSLGDQRIGSAWASALISGVTIMLAAQDNRVRRVIASVLIGFVCMLLLRGLLQVFVEHPQSIQNFRENKDRILAAHGWSPGSAMALGFERRLSQAEASGWFGLANVYASICAAAGTVGVGLTLQTLKSKTGSKTPAVAILLSGLIAISGIAGVVLANSKGGVIALGVGLMALAAFSLLPRLLHDRAKLARVCGLVGLLAIIGPLLLVVIRGAIGERVGELSILFRWFYMQASAKIFAEHPVFGVGPDGYQQGFLIAKPPLCPEEVSSPHSILWDYASTLGLFGLALCGFVLILAWLCGTRAVEKEHEGSHDRGAVRTTYATIAIAIVAALWLQTPLITLEMAVVYILGLGLWCAGAWGVHMALASGVVSRATLAAGALVLIAHSQIEVTGSNIASAGLWAGLIGLAASGRMNSRPRRPLILTGTGATASFAVTAIGIAACMAAIQARSWESQLKAAADAVRVIPEFSERLGALGTPAGAGDSIDRIVADLSVATGRPVQATQASVAMAMQQLEQDRYPIAVRALQKAHEVYPDDRRPLREASTLLARLAETSKDPAVQRSLFEQAIDVLRMSDGPGGQAVSRPLASEYGWLALVLERRAQVLKDPTSLTKAAAARERAQSLDPYNLDNTVRLAKTLDAMGDKARARTMAQRALEIDGLMRLDRAVKGLSERDRDAMQQLAK